MDIESRPWGSVERRILGRAGPEGSSFLRAPVSTKGSGRPVECFEQQNFPGPAVSDLSASEPLCQSWAGNST